MRQLVRTRQLRVLTTDTTIAHLSQGGFSSWVSELQPTHPGMSKEDMAAEVLADPPWPSSATSRLGREALVLRDDLFD